MSKQGGSPNCSGGPRMLTCNVLPDAHDDPTGVAAMAGGHVFRHSGVLMIATPALMHGNPLAFVEDLDAGGEPHLDLGTREAMRDAVVVLLHLDMVVEADAADPPLGSS